MDEHSTSSTSQANPSGDLPDGQVTYGRPEVYGGDQVGRFGTSSGSAGELPGGRMIDLAHGGIPADPARTNPDFPGRAPTSLDESEALNAGEPLTNVDETRATTQPEPAPSS